MNKLIFYLLVFIALFYAQTEEFHNTLFEEALLSEDYPSFSEDMEMYYNTLSEDQQRPWYEDPLRVIRTVADEVRKTDWIGSAREQIERITDPNISWEDRIKIIQGNINAGMSPVDYAAERIPIVKQIAEIPFSPVHLIDAIRGRETGGDQLSDGERWGKVVRWILPKAGQKQVISSIMSKVSKLEKVLNPKTFEAVKKAIEHGLNNPDQVAKLVERGVDIAQNIRDPEYREKLLRDIAKDVIEDRLKNNPLTKQVVDNLGKKLNPKKAFGKFLKSKGSSKPVKRLLKKFKKSAKKGNLFEKAKGAAKRFLRSKLGKKLKSKVGKLLNNKKFKKFLSKVRKAKTNKKFKKYAKKYLNKAKKKFGKKLKKLTKKIKKNKLGKTVQKALKLFAPKSRKQKNVKGRKNVRKNKQIKRSQKPTRKSTFKRTSPRKVRKASRGTRSAPRKPSRQHKPKPSPKPKPKPKPKPVRKSRPAPRKPVSRPSRSAPRRR